MYFSRTFGEASFWNQIYLQKKSRSNFMQMLRRVRNEKGRQFEIPNHFCLAIRKSSRASEQNDKLCVHVPLLDGSIQRFSSGKWYNRIQLSYSTMNSTRIRKKHQVCQVSRTFFSMSIFSLWYRNAFVTICHKRTTIGSNKTIAHTILLTSMTNYKFQKLHSKTHRQL